MADSSSPPHAGQSLPLTCLRCCSIRLFRDRDFAVGYREDGCACSDLIATHDPKVDGHDSVSSSYCHGTWQVGTDRYESVALHQEVEEEALMQLLQEGCSSFDRCSRLVLPKAISSCQP